MGTPSLSVSSTPGMSVEKRKKMSTEEDCIDDTRDKCRDLLLYLMQKNPIGYVHCTTLFSSIGNPQLNLYS
jgi:hypothetical protein